MTSGDRSQGGILEIYTTGVRRIFLGLKFRPSVFFWVKKSGGYFFGFKKKNKRIFLGFKSQSDVFAAISARVYVDQTIRFVFFGV